MPQSLEVGLRTGGKRFAVIASRFNDFIVDKLLEGAVDALRRAGAGDEDVEIFRCPGAFEIPGLARRLADSGRFSGIVCLGAVIRGATPHFDLVVGEAARGIATLALEGKVAFGFGVLALENVEQGLERTGSKSGNRGSDAALVAIEMANLYASLAPSDIQGAARPVRRQ